MSSTDRLNTLRGLVKEIDSLCEKTDREKEQFNDKLAADRKQNWLMFCTQIAPYFELAKEIKPKFNHGRLWAKTGIDDYEIGFDEEFVTLFYNSRTCISVHLIYQGDFKSLDQIIKANKIYQLASDNILVRLPKEFDFELFEKSFIQAVEEEMRMRSKLANSNYEQAKAKYEAERSA